MRLKLQLSDKAEPATVLKILQKLKDLDITLDVLAETGIGKTVNSLRRHEQAGELAKSLVKGWKKLLSKESISRGEDRLSEKVPSVKDKLDDQSSPNNGSLEMEDANSNDLTSHHSKNCDSSDDANFKLGKRKMDSPKGQCEGRKRKTDCEKSQENQMSGMLRSSDAQKRKRKHTTSVESEREHSKHKKAKTNETNSDPEEPSMSFESYLNYDVTLYKRKERSGVRKLPKKPKMVPSEQQIKAPVMKNMEEKRILLMKMQVYSGAKTVFLPAMLSLYQQCIRTLQNNINLLYETGGVPFEILEPVLEKCTPEQLLRIEECNPIYVGVTDHLWGKHCQRDFKDSKLQEYESWKEMYIRLSEERERKLKRLTKTIVSAQSQKPKGRQVKMAFIHTVAKPPRDVRIQQEIHGTAVQQPHQPRSRWVSASYIQMIHFLTRFSLNHIIAYFSNVYIFMTFILVVSILMAPMMAKSLKAFKKQLGRR
uniref:Elongin A, like n=1 Tax=Oreochromis niloticus TaxID=8128 RepID=A0A669F9M4_ORENI